MVLLLFKDISPVGEQCLFALDYEIRIMMKTLCNYDVDYHKLIFTQPLFPLKNSYSKAFKVEVNF